MHDTRRHLTGTITVRLPERLAARLAAAAHTEDRTRSEYVREVLRRDLLRRDATEAER